MATKYNSLVLMPAILLAHWMRPHRGKGHSFPFLEKLRDWRLYLGLGFLLLGFAFGNPYSFLDYRGFISDLAWIGNQHVPSTSTGLYLPFLKSFVAIGRQLSMNGAWLLALSALGGAILVGLRGSLPERFCALVLVLFLGKFLLSPPQFVLGRYFMPVIPLFLVLASYFLWVVWRRWSDRMGRSGYRYALGGVLVLIPLLLLGRGALNPLSLRIQDTYVRPEAFRWVLKNIPAETHVGINRSEYPFNDPSLFPALQFSITPELSAPLGRFQYFISFTSDSNPQERDLLEKLMEREDFVLIKRFEKDVRLLGLIRRPLPEKIAVFQRKD